MRTVPRETSLVAFPNSNPLPSYEEIPEGLAAMEPPSASTVGAEPGEPRPVSSEQAAPQGPHCPAGLCPRCWDAGVQVATARDREDALFCPRCEWTPTPPAPALPAPPAFQTLLLPNRVPGVDPMAHVAFWAGQPYEVLAIASPETVSCGSLALPPGARVFFLREMPR